MRAPQSGGLVASPSIALHHEATTSRALENLRRHYWRAARRLGALLVVDGLCFLIARLITRAVVGDSAVGYAASVFMPSAAGAPGGEIGLAVALLVGTTVSGTYGRGDAQRRVGRLFLAAAIASALPLWSHVWSRPWLEVLPACLLAFGPLFVALVSLRRAFDAVAHRWSLHPGAGTLARAVLVGTASDCLTRCNGALLGRRAGFDVLGFIDIGDSAHPSALGPISDMERILAERGADTVVFCGLPSPAMTSRVLRAAAVSECTVLASAPQLEHPAVRPNVVIRRGMPLLELRPVALRVEQLVLKRAMDIVGAVVVLVLLAPLLAVIAALVALDSPGPVIFTQRRLGRFGRPIRCYKFRSMQMDAEERLNGDPILFRQYVEHDYKLPASMDTRITRVGHFLRRASLDELPQLWNVLKGEMSLVGPRPIVPDEIHHYNGEGPLLLSLKPGITGAWQVSGRSAVAYPERAALELEYVEGWSLWRDLRILLRTLPVVVAGLGAH